MDETEELKKETESKECVNPKYYQDLLHEERIALYKEYAKKDPMSKEHRFLFFGMAFMLIGFMFHFMGRTYHDIFPDGFFGSFAWNIIVITAFMIFLTAGAVYMILFLMESRKSYTKWLKETKNIERKKNQ